MIGRRACRRVVAVWAVVPILALVACSDDSGSEGATTAASAVSAPSSSSTVTTSAGPTSAGPTSAGPTTTGVRPERFGTAAVEIRRADGTLCELCTYVARTGEERSRGLMGVTDLAGHDGMIFVFETADPHQFWMKNTVMPLSAAWFTGDGSFIEAFDMEPCPTDAQRCPTYGPADAVLHVLEVPRGDLTALGIGAGAVLLSVGAPCDPA